MVEGEDRRKQGEGPPEGGGPAKTGVLRNDRLGVRDSQRAAIETKTSPDRRSIN